MLGLTYGYASGANNGNVSSQTINAGGANTFNQTYRWNGTTVGSFDAAGNMTSRVNVGSMKQRRNEREKLQALREQLPRPRPGHARLRRCGGEVEGACRAGAGAPGAWGRGVECRKFLLVCVVAVEDRQDVDPVVVIVEACAPVAYA